MSHPSLLSIARSETRYEILKLLRAPAFAFPTLGFPIVFYLIFGILLNAGKGGAQTYLLAGYTTFGVIAPALFGFGVGVAAERTAGWLLLKHASPLPPAAYLLAKLGMAATFAGLIFLAMMTLAHTVGGVDLAWSQWLHLGTVLVLGTVPFCALGLAVGFWVNGQAAVAIVNLVYLPMSALSGLWFPLSMFPDYLQTLAWVFPTFHLGQLAFGAVEMGAGHPWSWHAMALFAYALVGVWLAMRGYRADDMALATA